MGKENCREVIRQEWLSFLAELGSPLCLVVLLCLRATLTIMYNRPALGVSLLDVFDA